MIVQMVHGLPGAAPVVGQQAVAGSDTGILGHGRSHPLQMPEQGLVAVAAGAQARDVLLGHDEEMNGALAA